MTGTHTPAEWAQMVSLAAGIWGACSVPYFLTVDADLADFDPRPALETGRLQPVWQVAVHAGRDAVWAAVSARHHAAPQIAAFYAAAVQARHLPRETAITAAALLSLTIPTGGNR